MDSQQSEGDKMADTVAMAKMERAKQGPRNVEVAHRGDSRLRGDFISCSNNPGHPSFISVDQFTRDHLPSGCRDDDLVDLVRAASYLNVRVTVKYISEQRPSVYPGGEWGFPLYNARGNPLTTEGTGWIFEVNKRTNRNNSEEASQFLNSSVPITCPCKECRNSPSPKTQFAIIYIHTTAHVVYDGLEASYTTCDLFFYKGDWPNESSGVVTLSDMSVVRSNAEIDFCEMRCVTHDLELADRLRKMVKHMHNVGRIIYDKNRRLKFKKQKSSPTEEHPPDARNNLTIIVSHPHGCSQHVTIGYCVGENDRENWRRLQYTAATCPGSGGALVIVLRDGRCLHWGNNIAHSGSRKHLNMSNVMVL